MSRLLRRMGLASKRPARDRDFVTVVSGLPRSGTSMMMKMLEAGGIDPLTDGRRGPDIDNPRGYYEYERVKGLRRGDDSWVPEARGRAVKVISELLRWLPRRYSYRVIFMRREMEEVLGSQRRMLERLERGGGAEDDRMASLYAKHLAQVEDWLSAQPHMEVLYVDYADVIADPCVGASKVNEYLGGSLDVESMARVIEPDLYRQRG